MSVYRNDTSPRAPLQLPSIHKPEAHIFNLLSGIGHSLGNQKTILTSWAQELNHVFMLRLRVCVSIEFKSYSLFLESLTEIQVHVVMLTFTYDCRWHMG